MSVVFTVLSLGISAFSIYLVQTTEDMDDKKFQLKYSIFFDGLKTDNKITAQYHNLVIIKKILQSMILILF